MPKMCPYNRRAKCSATSRKMSWTKVEISAATPMMNAVTGQEDEPDKARFQTEKG